MVVKTERGGKGVCGKSEVVHKRPTRRECDMEGGKAGACHWVMSNTLRTISSIIIRIINLAGAALSSKSLLHRREVRGHVGCPRRGEGLWLQEHSGG